MSDNDAMIELYKNIAEVQSINSQRWHKSLILCNVIWAVVVILVCVGFVVSFLVYESQFTTLDTSETITTITQESDDGGGNNVYQSGDRAIYNEDGD